MDAVAGFVDFAVDRARDGVGDVGVLMRESNMWMPIDAATPVGVWLETRREGEDGTNVCQCLGDPLDDPEWVEAVGGRTTVTHHSFAAPTHWREWLTGYGLK